MLDMLPAVELLDRPCCDVERYNMSGAMKLSETGVMGKLSRDDAKEEVESRLDIGVQNSGWVPYVKTGEEMVLTRGVLSFLTGVVSASICLIGVLDTAVE